MLVIGGDSPHQLVVVPVCFGGAEGGLVALDDDHCRAVGVELTEDVADACERLQRRGGIGRAERHVVLLADDFQLRHQRVAEDGDRQPEQQNGGDTQRAGQSREAVGQRAVRRLLVWSFRRNPLHPLAFR